MEISVLLARPHPPTPTQPKLSTFFERSVRVELVKCNSEMLSDAVPRGLLQPPNLNLQGELHRWLKPKTVDPSGGFLYRRENNNPPPPPPIRISTPVLFQVLFFAYNYLGGLGGVTGGLLTSNRWVVSSNMTLATA